MSETDLAQESLRERRRRQTVREVGEVALTLFEERGIDGTTVDDIAARAGVSARTFFRHFATKECAALVPHEELERLAKARLAALDGARPLLAQLEVMWGEVMAGLDNGRSPAGQQMLRLRTLMATEPGLRATAIGVDEARLAATVELVRDRMGAAATDLRPEILVETAAAVVRLALDRWAAARDAGLETDLVATYVEACGALREVTG